ncbi:MULTISPECIES: trehalose-phosphatase [Kitasatospora]|uniref:Trehalose 6-phosphate phosphatase n=1 Tax=Kitasatospora setae (strain ATCC 33774 / DSM 43861 / JCM 3304 / KCC A-0304 / NBRC 14216 / KM-6054) TaxID=452652 RepID=E4NFA8_KITSK|nr:MULTISPECIES: trehalose-phosphatase [Kitasatospora]BAJ30188.1 putative trehalose-6-phosphatase [Kitasatospora setae KM-6054]
MGIAEQITTQAGRTGLAGLLADPKSAVVGLDFDGTLAPIVADPERARAHPGVVPALGALAPLVGAVVVVTGRPAATAAAYGGFVGAPGLEHLTVLGHYGAERWDARSNAVTAAPPPPGVAAVRAELPALLRELGVPEGTFTEDKERALAVHTRRAPEPDALLEHLRGPLDALARRHGLVVEPGRMVLELRPPGVDKGVALRGFLAERDAGPVLFAGDDLGDLAAYAEVDARRAAGHPGLLVCSGPVTGEPPVAELADRADLVVAGPAGVVDLLDGLAELLTR